MSFLEPSLVTHFQLVTHFNLKILYLKILYLKNLCSLSEDFFLKVLFAQLWIMSRKRFKVSLSIIKQLP